MSNEVTNESEVNPNDFQIKFEALESAVKKGDSKAVTTLLNDYPALVFYQYHFSNLLSTAIKEGQHEIMKTLIDHEVTAIMTDEDGHPIQELDENDNLLFNEEGNPIYQKTQVKMNLDFRNADQKTPLYLASELDDKEAVSILLNHGADPKVPNADTDEMTPLHVASALGNVEIMGLLMGEGAPVNALDAWKKTPIFCAVKNGKLEATELLLENKGDVHIKNRDLETILHAAIKSNNYELVELIVGAGVDVNEMNACQITPLCYAAELEGHERLKIVKLLVEKKADVDATNSIYYTGEPHYKPLHVAIGAGNDEVVEFLLYQNADPNLLGKVDVGNIGLVYLPLTAAVYGDRKDMLQLLLGYSADINGKNLGDTALHKAAEIGCRDAMEFLVERGAELNITNGFHGMTPLSRAVQRGSTKDVEYLIERNADVNFGGKVTNWPLDDAMETGNSEMIKFLLEQGAKSAFAMEVDSEPPAIMGGDAMSDE